MFVTGALNSEFCVGVAGDRLGVAVAIGDDERMPGDVGAAENDGTDANASIAGLPARVPVADTDTGGDGFCAVYAAASSGEPKLCVLVAGSIESGPKRWAFETLGTVADAASALDPRTPVATGADARAVFGEYVVVGTAVGATGLLGPISPSVKLGSSCPVPVTFDRMPELGSDVDRAGEAAASDVGDSRPGLACATCGLYVSGV